MSVTDEQRQAVTELAFRALDTIDETDADATLADAILVYEIVHADGSTEGNWHSTSTRASVNVGMLAIAAAVMTAPEREDD